MPRSAHALERKVSSTPAPPVSAPDARPAAKREMSHVNTTLWRPAVGSRNSLALVTRECAAPFEAVESGFGRQERERARVEVTARLAHDARPKEDVRQLGVPRKVRQQRLGFGRVHDRWPGPVGRRRVLRGFTRGVHGGDEHVEVVDAALHGPYVGIGALPEGICGMM